MRFSEFSPVVCGANVAQSSENKKVPTNRSGCANTGVIEDRQYMPIGLVVEERRHQNELSAENLKEARRVARKRTLEL